MILGELFFGTVFFIKDARHQLIHLDNVTDYPYLYFSFKPEPGKFVNEDGLYTRKKRVKGPGKYRILLIGGSIVRSAYLDYDKTISSYLEQELNGKFQGNAIEVVNAGMSGYVTEQEFIFIQLVLQYYEPDMIIGLDGYNDLMSFKLNRSANLSFAPQNWRDFKVIQKGKDEKKWHYRLRAVFRNTSRAIDFAGRIIKQQNPYDYSTVKQGDLEALSGRYINTVKDMNDFCASKNIRFFSFLQPVKWYSSGDSQNVRFGGIPALASLYRKYDAGIRELDYGFSLVDIFEGRTDIYFDDCHVTSEGNKLFAEHIADLLEKELTDAIHQNTL